MFKRLATAAAITAAALTSLPASAAFVFGINPSTPLAGYNLGDGRYATKVGLQFNTTGSTFVGKTVSVGDLTSAIVSGSVSAWYYAAGNNASAMFDGFAQFDPFLGDTVVAGLSNTNPNRVWDSLFAIHTGNVVFRTNPATSGTTTMGIGGQRINDNPFERSAQVPEPSTLALLGLALTGLALTRRSKASQV